VGTLSDNERFLDRAEITMLRRMCDAMLKYNKRNESIRKSVWCGNCAINKARKASMRWPEHISEREIFGE